MMLGGPFLSAVIPGILVTILTWWFRKKELSILVKLLPCVLTVVAAGVLFYIGFVRIRGFEGAAYGFLAFFLLVFAFISLLIATKSPKINK
ncbi:YesK family protein [Priestia aryabhattai]